MPFVWIRPVDIFHSSRLRNPLSRKVRSPLSLSACQRFSILRSPPLRASRFALPALRFPLCASLFSLRSPLCALRLALGAVLRTSTGFLTGYSPGPQNIFESFLGSGVHVIVGWVVVGWVVGWLPAAHFFALGRPLSPFPPRPLSPFPPEPYWSSAPRFPLCASLSDFSLSAFQHFKKPSTHSSNTCSKCSSRSG